MQGKGQRAYWDTVAREAPAWYVSTGHIHETEEFFRQGAAEADTFLSFCDVQPGSEATVLEIGCGVGRMTGRLAELFNRVIALDVSDEMLGRCQRNLSSRANVEYVLVDGDGSLGSLGEDAVDVVFSYLTFQHVPTRAAQLRYFENSARALRAGGKMAVQIRSSSLLALGLTYASHFLHRISGRRTLSRSWRGSRVRPRAVIAALHREGVDASIRAWPYRPLWSPAHLWVVGTKNLQS